MMLVGDPKYIYSEARVAQVPLFRDSANFVSTIAISFLQAPSILFITLYMLSTTYYRCSQLFADGMHVECVMIIAIYWA